MDLQELQFINKKVRTVPFFIHVTVCPVSPLCTFIHLDRQVQGRRSRKHGLKHLCDLSQVFVRTKKSSTNPESLSGEAATNVSATTLGFTALRELEFTSELLSGSCLFCTFDFAFFLPCRPMKPTSWPKKCHRIRTNCGYTVVYKENPLKECRAYSWIG